MSWYWIAAIVVVSLQAYVVCGILTSRLFEIKGWSDDEVDKFMYGMFWPFTGIIGCLLFGAKLWIDVSKRLIGGIVSLPARRRSRRDFPTARAVKK